MLPTDDEMKIKMVVGVRKTPNPLAPEVRVARLLAEL
jgi:hypothetical protein